MNDQILDMLGAPIEVGDFLIIPHRTERKLQIVQVIGFTPCKIKIKYIINKTMGDVIEKGDYKYCKVEPPLVTFMQLKNSK